MLMAEQKLNRWQRRAIFEEWGGKCAYCSKPLDWDEFEVDHIIPETKKSKLDDLERIKQDYNLSREFDITSYNNLALSCRRCNNKKRDQDKTRGYLSMVLGEAESKAPKIEEKVKKMLAKKPFKNTMELEEAVEIGLVPIEDVIKIAIKNLPAYIQKKASKILTEGITGINIIAIQCFETIKTYSCTERVRQVVVALKLRIGNLLFLVFMEGMLNGQLTDKGLLAISFTATLVTSVCIKVTEINQKRNGETVWNYS